MARSGKRKSRLPKSNPNLSEEEEHEPIILSSSDDEADEDLSLKIVQKSMLRACANEQSNTNPSSSSSSPAVNKKAKKTKVKKKKKKKKKMKIQDDVVEETVEIKVEDGAPKETDAIVETDPSEKSDNIVLRKLLRGPRYFDPPDNSWGNCYNCGEGGHTAANCTSAKRKKPCFVCGSFEHNVKECNKGKDCFICKKSGHRAKDCPEKSNYGSQITKLCLKCGGSGHEMFTCKAKYSADDLKEIQCYICKCFGHLCCVNYTDEGPLEVSCYRCGQLGHSGWECARVHAEATSTGTPSSCFKCGQEGHMARKCTNSAKEKKEKRKGEFSSPRKKGNYGNHIGVRSVPPDFGNARKKNKTQYVQPSPSQTKPRGRGGWMTEHPGDYDNNNNNHARGSPKTPTAKYNNKFNDRFHGGSGYNNSIDRYHGDYGYKFNDRYHGGGGGSSGGGGGYNLGYVNNGRRYHQYDSPVGSSGYQQRFSASRFGNSSNYGNREYSWDY
ncbi:uncharacterized protein [Rutidosis leptorrhynchoides]|uniref:uncharacterized protein n=1 Tax=Rutidosis leptorrhynchoides TaxID=125765 RepID=UPI003A99BEB4